MRIVIATVQVPFIRGGAEYLAENLAFELRERGHQAEIISIPFRWYPESSLLDSMVMGRMLDLSDSAYQKNDLMIGLKFPAYYANHANKVLWLLHQHRQAYDLFNTRFGDLHQTRQGRKTADFVRQTDQILLGEYKRRYTISQNVSDRLLRYSGLSSEPLYHPPPGYLNLRCESYDNYIIFPSRIDQMKRQRRLVEAAQYMKSEAKIKFIGSGDPAELEYLQRRIRELDLSKRVEILGRVSDQEKNHLYAHARAVFFGCYDEDYGYVALEALFAAKPLVLFDDAGGPLEFVSHGENGFIVPDDPKVLAETLDILGEDQGLAEKLGKNGLSRILAKQVSWEHTIQRLLGIPSKSPYKGSDAIERPKTME